ncbi:hypothetical protein PQD13_gp25 [Gordonia phage Clawz]|uniref:Uncharacterized protein n=1 Tax=Gordonia phage Clawz TaxID=2743910 RepID=A0AAE7F9L8_9CAUD|nr:hypothetical protein PQD13_gp25 [Gordonia phage Clawz]QKY79937.1 hypothetical protein SEA_CLAWZ_25 [Gordonia phage Clawz]
MTVTALPRDQQAVWWVIIRQDAAPSAFGPFHTDDDAHTFSTNDPIADDQVAENCLDEQIITDSVDGLAARGITDLWIVREMENQ